MTIKAFQARILKRIRQGLKRKASTLARVRKASLEALHLCGRHHASIPDRVVLAYERRYEDLWKTREKRDIL